MARRLLAWVPALVALAAVALVGSRSDWTAFAGDPRAWAESDFEILWAAGQGLREGRDVTDAAVLDELGQRAGRAATPFSASHPLVARLVGALPGHDFPSAYRLALWGQGLLALLVVVLLAAILVHDGLALPWAVALALAALGLGDGLWMSVAMNSANLVTLAAVCGAVLAAQRGWSVVEGLALALAVLAKTSPALLALAALLAGRVRTAVACALGWLLAGALSVAWQGWAPHAAWLARTAPALGYAPELEPGRFNNALHAWNLAPHGLLARQAYAAGLPRLMVLAAAWAVAALVLWQLLLVARAQRGPRGAATLASAALAGSLLVSSVTWPHHLVWAALPLALLASALGRAPWPAWLGLAAGTLLLLPLGALGAPELDLPLRTAACVLLFAALAALPPASRRPQLLGASP